MHLLVIMANQKKIDKSSESIASTYESGITEIVETLFEDNKE